MQPIIATATAPLNSVKHLNFREPSYCTSLQASVDLALSAGVPLQLKLIFGWATVASFRHRSSLLLE